jgi:hypothetical protein
VDVKRRANAGYSEPEIAACHCLYQLQEQDDYQQESQFAEGYHFQP